MAAITYGPLLGLFAFGLLMKNRPRENVVPVVCLVAAVVTFLLRAYSKEIFFGYQLGFETLILNGLLTFVGLWLVSNDGPQPSAHRSSRSGSFS